MKSLCPRRAEAGSSQDVHQDVCCAEHSPSKILRKMDVEPERHRTRRQTTCRNLRAAQVLPQSMEESDATEVRDDNGYDSRESEPRSATS